MICRFDKGSYCMALTDKKCKGCAFKRTQEEYNRSQKESWGRIRSLSNETQYYIAGKYYNGIRAWNK